MAWRIHENVVRGEIDNRERGVVRGTIWVEGLEQPVKLELTGNAAPDLAGCLLKFENPGPRAPLRKDAQLAPLQRGSVGDLTASRKVRVLDVPAVEACLRREEGLPVPEHMANCLYLEWFSEAHGRVVIESVDFIVTLSPPSWRLSPDEEQARQKQTDESFSGFLQKLSDALEAHKHVPPEDKPWDEFDYERFMRECDARTDKYAELLDKYRDNPDRDKIVAREMGWDGPESEDPTGPEEVEEVAELGQEAFAPKDEENEGREASENSDTEDAPELQPDPATEGVDWVRGEEGDITHPLVRRVLEGSTALAETYANLQLDNTTDEDLVSLLAEYQTTTAKLGGALDGLAYGRSLTEGPFIVACLKRALSHLYSAQAALAKVATRRLLPREVLAPLRSEFFSVREEILRLMQEFRRQA